MIYQGVRACGCVTAMVVNEPDHPKDTARAVAEFIAAGLTIRTVDVGAFTRCAKHEGLSYADWRCALWPATGGDGGEKQGGANG